MSPRSLRCERLDRVRHEIALRDFAQELRDEGDERFALFLDDPDAFFELARRFEEGRDLPPERVRTTQFLFFDEARLVGASRLRHALIPVLLLDGGNIGYEVRRSARRRGHATQILCQTLLEARAIGLSRVLLTTGAGNAGSIRAIERVGGQADGLSVSPRTGETMRRYWLGTEAAI